MHFRKFFSGVEEMKEMTLDKYFGSSGIKERKEKNENESMAEGESRNQERIIKENSIQEETEKMKERENEIKNEDCNNSGIEERIIERERESGIKERKEKNEQESMTKGESRNQKRSIKRKQRK